MQTVSILIPFEVLSHFPKKRKEKEKWTWRWTDNLLTRIPFFNWFYRRKTRIKWIKKKRKKNLKSRTGITCRIIEAECNRNRRCTRGLDPFARAGNTCEISNWPWSNTTLEYVSTQRRGLLAELFEFGIDARSTGIHEHTRGTECESSAFCLSHLSGGS